MNEYFTLVFEGSLASFAGNPLKTKTPFGVPVVAGVGNAFDIIERLSASNAELAEALRLTRGVLREEIDHITQSLDAASDAAIGKSEG